MNRPGVLPCRSGRCIVERATVPVLMMLATIQAGAHDGSASLGIGWRMEPWIVLLLVASALLYLRGTAAMWRRAGAGRGIQRRHAAAFAAGWLGTATALAPPIDPLGQQLFFMHMVQHELLMVVAAPLLVLGRPFVAWSWAWPTAARQVHRAFSGPWLGALWHHVTSPLGAWLLHAAALWVWHVPRFFEAALADTGVHELQHASFFVTALLFWWSILGRRTSVRSHAVALLSLFTTMLHTGVLGALLTLSPRVWYPAYVPSALALGFDPLHDQQLGGVLMWVPAGAAYIVAALTAGTHLLRPSASAAPKES